MLEQGIDKHEASHARDHKARDHSERAVGANKEKGESL